MGAGRHRCDAIARHVDTACRWEHVGRHVTLIHFKGKGKPWKHLPPPCAAVSLGPFIRAAWPQSAVAPSDVLRWDMSARGTSPGMAMGGACRRVTIGFPPEGVAFADGTRVPKVCCETNLLQKASWYGVVRAAGLQPPPPVW